MPQLVNGIWQEEHYEPPRDDGRFDRQESQFRHWVTADGSSGFPAQAGRYHLYVSLACPWAHRTLILRKLKGLEDVIGLSVVDPHMGDRGWYFSDGPGCIPDTVNGFDHAHQLYTRARPDYTGEVTIPVLWDKHTGTIVNNESADIVRMFNSAFDAFGNPDLDFYPEPLRADIDRINEFVYEDVNNGVYRTGFAENQEAYEEAFDQLFSALQTLDRRLGEQRYLVGDRITEADWRLFTTLVRFDAVYHLHFKCNLHRLVDYPDLWAYTRELYQVPGVSDTVNMDHIKRHYYTSHPFLNPSGLIPKGPELDFSAPHGRG